MWNLEYQFWSSFLLGLQIGQKLPNKINCFSDEILFLPQDITQSLKTMVHALLEIPNLVLILYLVGKSLTDQVKVLIMSLIKFFCQCNISDKI